jgi:hypothetical protein
MKLKFGVAYLFIRLLRVKVQDYREHPQITPMTQSGKPVQYRERLTLSCGTHPLQRPERTKSPHT